MDDLPNFFENELNQGTSNFLCWDCDDFLKAARPYLDLQPIESLIETYFNNCFEPHEKTFLSLRFRHAVNYFRCVADIDMPVSQKYHIEKAYIVNFLKEHIISQERDCSKRQKEYEKIICGTHVEKWSEIYTIILNHEMFSGKENVSKFIKKYIEKNKVKVKGDTLRRGYVRWRKKQNLNVKTYRWPTMEFIKFMSLISVYYKEVSTDNLSQQSVILLKDDVQPNALWKKAQALKYTNEQTCQKTEFDKINQSMSNTDQHKKIKMKELATNNNVYAIQWIIQDGGLKDKKIERFKIQLALFDFEEMREELNWKSNLCLPSLLPSNRYQRICLAQEQFSNNDDSVIPAQSIVESLEVIVKSEKEELKDWRSQYRYTLLGKNISKFFIPHPNMYQLDEIMKMGDALQRISFIFPSKQEMIFTNFIIGDPVILKPETIKVLTELNSYLCKIDNMPEKIKFSIDELKNQINAELKYAKKAALLCE